MAPGEYGTRVSKASVALERALEKALKKAGKRWGAKAALAKEMGLTPDVVSRWVRGFRTPTPPQRAELQRKFKIDWRDWDQPAEPGGAPTRTFRAASGDR